MLNRLLFPEIWAVDFEFDAKLGENPKPVCLVAWELCSGRKLRQWRDDFGPTPPYPIGPDVLFVAFAGLYAWSWVAAFGFLALWLAATVLYRRHQRR